MREDGPYWAVVSVEVFLFFALLGCPCVCWIIWLTLTLMSDYLRDCSVMVCWILDSFPWCGNFPCMWDIMWYNSFFITFPLKRSLMFKNTFGKLFATNLVAAVRIILLSGKTKFCGLCESFHFSVIQCINCLSWFVLFCGWIHWSPEKLMLHWAGKAYGVHDDVDVFLAEKVWPNVKTCLAFVAFHLPVSKVKSVNLFVIPPRGREREREREMEREATACLCFWKNKTTEITLNAFPTLEAPFCYL